MAGPHLLTHPVPCDGGGSNTLQFQPLFGGRCAECVEETPHPGPQGTLAFLVGGRPKLC